MAKEEDITLQPARPRTPQLLAPQPSQYHRYLDDILGQYEKRKKENEKADYKDEVRTSISSLADMANAITKLYGTTRHAPYVPGEQMSDRARQRAAQMKANRDQDLEHWRHFVLDIANRKHADEQNERNQQRADQRHQDNIRIQEQRLLGAQKKAEEERKKREEKALMDMYGDSWKTSFYNNNYTLDDDAVSAALDDDVAIGKITPVQRDMLKQHYDGVKARLQGNHAERMKTYEERANYKAQTSTTRGGGRGGNGGTLDIPTPYGDVSWSKNIERGNGFAHVYNVMVGQNIDGYYRKPKVSQEKMKQEIQRFFYDHNVPEASKKAVYHALVDVQNGKTSTATPPQPKSASAAGLVHYPAKGKVDDYMSVPKKQQTSGRSYKTATKK